MKILPISNNYKNNTNFKGTVDKSVVRYLDEVRFDALNKPNAFFESQKVSVADYEKVKPIIEGIMSKLNDFMAQMHSKTKILLKGDLLTRDIYFENTELNSNIFGSRFWLAGSEEEYGTVDDKGTIFLRDPDLKVFKRTESHTLQELERFDKYTAELTTMFAPKDIDGALFDSKAIDVIKHAEETAPKNRFENRIAFNNLDKLAPKFNRQPIYKEQFHIIQALAYKLQEEKAKDPIEKSKEELKNLKIK